MGRNPDLFSRLAGFMLLLLAVESIFLGALDLHFNYRTRHVPDDSGLRRESVHETIHLSILLIFAVLGLLMRAEILSIFCAALMIWTIRLRRRLRRRQRRFALQGPDSEPDLRPPSPPARPRPYAPEEY